MTVRDDSRISVYSTRAVSLNRVKFAVNDRPPILYRGWKTSEKFNRWLQLYGKKDTVSEQESYEKNRVNEIRGNFERIEQCDMEAESV